MSHRPLMAALAVAGIVALSGCAVQRPLSGEARVESSLLATASAEGAPAPFCLHLRWGNRFYGAYSGNTAEAWVSEGPCAADGAARSVESISLGWRYRWDAPQTQICAPASQCRLDAHHIVLGKVFECLRVQVRDGAQQAFFSTDQAACP